MDSTDKTAILKRYRKSSLDDRIFLFLDHPGIRSEFTAIDMAEDRQKRSVKSGAAVWGPRFLHPIKTLLTRISFAEKPSPNLKD